MEAMYHIVGEPPTLSTVNTWRTTLRKEGVDIPDKRRRDSELTSK